MAKESKGHIELDVRDSTTGWSSYTPPSAPEGPPNILIVLYDDSGLGAWEPLGGRIRMPTAQRLADKGLTYTPGTSPLCGDGLCVDRASGNAVSHIYRAPGEFAGGTIRKVEVSVGADRYLDLEREAFAALARE